MTITITPAQRKAIYALVAATMPMLVAYGILDAEKAALWTALVINALTALMAFAHTSTGTEDGMPEEDGGTSIELGVTPEHAAPEEPADALESIPGL